METNNIDELKAQIAQLQQRVAELEAKTDEKDIMYWGADNGNVVLFKIDEDFYEKYEQRIKDAFRNCRFGEEWGSYCSHSIQTLDIEMLKEADGWDTDYDPDESDEEIQDQDDFTNRDCQNCGKGFDLADPHYYDEENGECFCDEDCFKKYEEKYN